jgi:hypothetical protein
MSILDSKSDQELLKSVLAETAKATNELACAQADINKAKSRINFVLVLVNKLIDRNGDKQI